MAVVKKLTPRNRPTQQRSIERRRQILNTTAKLLDQVGFDDLTTILVARDLGISVGTLYHYYPNKQAILHALAENWLRAAEDSLVEMAEWDLDGMALETFVDRAIERILETYRNQRGILPLVQAMFAVPELRELDSKHDDMVISHMSRIFRRLNIQESAEERERIARTFLELTHALLLVVVNQKGERSRRTLEELKFLTLSLLTRSRDS